jgi:hypothetical protein
LHFAWVSPRLDRVLGALTASGIAASGIRSVGDRPDA